MINNSDSEQLVDAVRGVLGQDVPDDEILKRISVNLELLGKIKEIVQRSIIRQKDSNQTIPEINDDFILSELNLLVEKSSSFDNIRENYTNYPNHSNEEIVNLIEADIQFARKIRSLASLNSSQSSVDNTQSSQDDLILSEINSNVDKIKNDMEQLGNAKDENSRLEQIICDLRAELALFKVPPEQKDKDIRNRFDRNRATLDSKLLALQHDLNIHNKGLKQMIKHLKEQIKALQEQIRSEKELNEKERAEAAGKIANLQTINDAKDKEIDNLKGQIQAIREEKESEAIDQLMRQLHDMSRLFAEMTQEAADLREKLAKSKDTLFANRIRKNFQDIEDDEEIADIIDADTSIVNSLMHLLKPNATPDVIKEWRHRLISSINELSKNEKLMSEMRNMFDLASQERLPSAFADMRKGSDELTQRSNQLLEEALKKISDKPEIDALMVVTFVLFTTFLLRPPNEDLDDFEFEEEEEEAQHI
ncbi:hypothetical protein M9Y10_008401 [Tritrichomonas musculus]|uniref:Uncharacterized protein n=1 Tax=Tritrichomonas musculus TaxID=1915356 RepID=A0ABR2IZU1_9EUKA